MEETSPKQRGDLDTGVEGVEETPPHPTCPCCGVLLKRLFINPKSIEKLFIGSLGYDALDATDFAMYLVSCMHPKVKDHVRGGDLGPENSEPPF